MPRVLIPTDEPNFTLGLVEGYRALGWEIATGTNNFKIRASRYDVVHHQWPEEYSGWQVPTQREIEQIKQHLQWWSSQSTNIFSVNNLYPHNGIGSPAYHELYSCFYQHCHLITHYSNASHRLVLEEFPVAHRAQHVIHCPPNYEVTLAIQRQRGSRRADMGIGEDEFVILILGRLRSWEEIQLIRRAFDSARVPKKRLLMAGKLALTGSWWSSRLSKVLWYLWLKSRNAVVDMRYVPEDEISRFLDSSDVAIVPRLGGLSSAVPLVAMTFGRMVIAPDCGAYPEYFLGTRNLLYKTGSAASLAAMLEKAAALDTYDIGRENAMIASKWNWQNICLACLEAVRKRGLKPA